MIHDRGLRLSVGTMSLCCIALAQTSVTRHISVRPEALGPLAADPLLEIVKNLDAARLRPVVSGGWESQLLNAAKSSALKTVRRTLGTAGGYYTLSTNEGDVLVGRWTGPNAGGQDKAIWLWDTAGSTNFIFQTDPAVLGSSTLPGFLENLLIWDEYPVKLTAVQLNYAESSASSGQQVVGAGTHLQQERGIFGWRLVGVSVGGDAYLSISMTKPFFRSEYPADALVPERFPPLRDRLKALPRTALFGELGKGYVPRRGNYPAGRDRIVVNELFSRGPVSDIEVSRIVMGDFELNRSEWEVVNSRMHSFLEVVQQRGELSAYSPGLERLCMTAKPGGAFSDTVLSAVYGTMGRNKVDFSRVALALMNRDEFVKSSLWHLSWYAQTEEVFQSLSRSALEPEYEPMKQAALKQIRARIQGHR